MVSQSSISSEKATPQISVITVVYNDKKHLEQTIQSVVNQVYKNIEYLIIDGGSTDGTLDVIKKHEGQVSYWLSESDSGIYDAMNKGIHAANGDYLIFLNAGDTFASNRLLEDVAQDISLNDYPDVVYGSANIYSENGVFIKELNALQFTRLNLILFGTRTVCHQSIFVKKSISPLYSKYYKLKGELAWYFDILDTRPKPRYVRMFTPISNYLLGGVGDISFTKNIFERLQVVSRKEGIFGCALVVPSLLITIMFRLKKILVNRK